jgi:hypothetical protein
MRCPQGVRRAQDVRNKEARPWISQSRSAERNRGASQGGTPTIDIAKDAPLPTRHTSCCCDAARLETTMNKLTLVLTAVALLSLEAKPAAATDLYAWNNHSAPFNFRFGNEIDGHQLSRVNPSGDLLGLLYVHYTGTVTRDGYRVATHADCNRARCTVGWTFNGTRLDGRLLGQEMDDHPLFFVDRADLPQPGAFSHFHWLGELPPMGESATGYLLQLVAVDRFCFIHHDAGSATGAKSCRENGGIALNPGLDAASHLNVVTSLPTPAM